MSEIERYNCYGWDIRRGEMRAEPDGQYVSYTDHVAALARSVEAEPCTTCAGTGFMDKDGARIAMQRTPCPDCATPPDQSQEIEQLRKDRDFWKDRFQVESRARIEAESRLASQERAPVVGELVIEAINDVLIDAEVEYPVGYHKGMHTITFDEDQMRAALEAALASSREEGE